jgi:hypothetical protein
MLRHREDVVDRLNREFPNQYAATKKTIEADIAWMKHKLKDL